MSSSTPFKIIFQQSKKKNKEPILLREEEKNKMLFLLLGQTAIYACSKIKDLVFELKIQEQEVVVKVKRNEKIGIYHVQNMVDYRRFIDEFSLQENLSLSYFPNMYAKKKLEDAYQNPSHIGSYTFYIYQNQKENKEEKTMNEEIIVQESIEEKKNKEHTSKESTSFRTHKKIKKKKRYFLLFLFLFRLSPYVVLGVFAKNMTRKSGLSTTKIAEWHDQYILLDHEEEVEFTLDEIKSQEDQKVFHVKVCHFDQDQETEVKTKYQLFLTTTNNIPLNVQVSEEENTTSFSSKGNGEMEKLLLLEGTLEQQKESHTYTLIFSIATSSQSFIELVDEIDQVKICMTFVQIE